MCGLGKGGLDSGGMGWVRGGVGRLGCGRGIRQAEVTWGGVWKDWVGLNGIVHAVLSTSLRISAIAFISNPLAAIVVIPIPPMPYITVMFVAGAWIRKTFWAVTPRAQLLVEMKSAVDGTWTRSAKAIRN